MDVTELEKLTTVDNLYKASTKISGKDNELINSFLIKKFIANGDYGMYPYFLNPYWSDISGNFRFRYLLVNINNDVVAIFFKYVFIFTTRYIRLVEKPISFLETHENEELVYKLLLKNNLIKQVLTTIAVGEPKDYDYFVDIREHWAKVSSGSWRHKHRVNQFINSSSLTMTLATKEDTEDIMNLYIAWGSLFPKPPESKTLKNAISLIGTGKVIASCLRFNGVLIATSIYLSTFSTKHLICPIGITMGRFPLESFEKIFKDVDVKILTTLKEYISSIFSYKETELFNALGISCIYAAGARESSRKENLLANKSRFYPKHIDYYIVEGDLL